VITVKGIDAPSICKPGRNSFSSGRVTRQLVAAPRAASAGRVGRFNASLANGTLAIANQPDVPRQGILVVDPGTTAISAGVAAITYVANDGSTVVDSKSVVTPASTIVSSTTSKGIVSLTSVIVTALAGGARQAFSLTTQTPFRWKFRRTSPASPFGAPMPTAWSMARQPLLRVQPLTLHQPLPTPRTPTVPCLASLRRKRASHDLLR
jgi:hypothetical protein